MIRPSLPGRLRRKFAMLLEELPGFVRRVYWGDVVFFAVLIYVFFHPLLGLPGPYEIKW